MSAGLRLVIERGGFERFAFNSTDNSECELFAVWFLVWGTASKQ